MDQHISALPQGAAATAEKERETFAAFGAGHIADISQGDFYNSVNRVQLKDRIQIGFESGFGIIAEIIALRARDFSGISIAIFPALTEHISERYRGKQRGQHARF